MIVTVSDKKWFDEFIVELRMRDVLGHAIGDAVASARELLADTGQSAEDAFGPARTYAASLELPRDSGPGWATRGLWPSLLGVLAFLLFVQAFVAWAQDDRFLVSPAQLALLVAPAALVAFLPLYLHAAMRRPWLLGLLAIVGAIMGFLSSAVAPASPREAWLSLDPVPWLLGSTASMVLLSLWNTVQTLRRGTVDDITNPLPGQVPNRYRARRAFVMLTNWFFPISRRSCSAFSFCSSDEGDVRPENRMGRFALPVTNPDLVVLEDFLEDTPLFDLKRVRVRASRLSWYPARAQLLAASAPAPVSPLATPSG